MNKAKRARLLVSGELIHMLLKFPDDIEVCDVGLCLQGEGLPDSCQIPEGGRPQVIDASEIPNWWPGR